MLFYGDIIASLDYAFHVLLAAFVGTNHGNLIIDTVLTYLLMNFSRKALGKK